jgi:hypothetical protein
MSVKFVAWQLPKRPTSRHIPGQVLTVELCLLDSSIGAAIPHAQSIAAAVLASYDKFATQLGLVAYCTPLWPIATLAAFAWTASIRFGQAKLSKP